MSAFIALDDGRSWWAANWAYDAVVNCIASELNRTEAERELAAWLREQTCWECGPGLGSVDVRELSPESCRAFREAAQRAFREAAQRAFRSAVLEGAAGWHDPSFFSAWLAEFRRLLRMWKAIDRSEPAGQLGDCPKCMERSGRQVGPGWPASSARQNVSSDRPRE